MDTSYSADISNIEYKETTARKKIGRTNLSGQENTTKQSDNKMTDIVANGRDIDQSSFPKDQLMENLLAENVSEYKKGDNTRIRSLRNRKPMDYFPKENIGCRTSKPETQSGKNENDPLTVLDWYKDMAKTLKESKEIESQSEHSNPMKTCKSMRLREICNSSKLPKFVRAKVKVLRGPYISQHSFPDNGYLESLPPKSLAFAALTDKNETAKEYVYTDESKEEQNFSNKIVEILQDLSTHDIIEDFEIGSLLQELGVHPKNIHESSEAVENKSPCKEEEVFSGTLDKVAKNFGVDVDSSVSNPSVSVMNDEECSSDVLPSNEEVLITSIRSDNYYPVEECIEDEREISMQETVPELLNVCEAIKLQDQNKKIESGKDLNSEFSENGEDLLRLQRKGLRNLSPVSYFPDMKRKMGNQEGKKIFKINKSRNKKEATLKLKSKTNIVSQSDMTSSEQTHILSNVSRSKIVETEGERQSGTPDLHSVENVMKQRSQVEEPSYYGKEYCDKENFRDPNNNDMYMNDFQTEPLDLCMHSLSFLESQLDSVPQTCYNLEKKTFRVGKTVKSVPKKKCKKMTDRSQKHKRNTNSKNSNTTMEMNINQIHSLTTLNEVTNIQPEALNLSSPVLRTESDKQLFDLKQSDFVSGKRVLRNRSPVTYFPDNKKRKQAVNQACSSSFSEAEKKDEILNHNCGPDIVTDYGNGVNSNSITKQHDQQLDFQPKPLDLSMLTPGHEVMSIEARMSDMLNAVDCKVSTSRRDIHALDNRQHELEDLHITDMVTDKSETNNQSSVDEPMVCEMNSKEKAANVNTALVGLYVAENIKEGQNKTLITGSDKFMSSTAEGDPDVFNGSDGQEKNNEAEIGTTSDMDDLNGSLHIVESELEQSIVENTQEKVTIKPLPSNVVCNIKELSSHNHELVENEDPTIPSNEPVETKNLPLPSTVNQESDASLQTKSTSLEGTEKMNHEEEVSEQGQPLRRQSEILPANEVEENVQNLLDVNLSSTQENTSSKTYPVGTVVWGRFSKARWWAAVVVDGRMLKRETRQGRSWVFWLSDNRVSELKNNHIEVFTSHYKQRTSGRLTESMKIGILKALQICSKRAKLDLSSFQSIEEWGQSASGFLQLANGVNDSDGFPPNEASPLPSYVLEQLGIIKKRIVVDNDIIAIPNESRVAGLDNNRVAVPDTAQNEIAGKRNKTKEKKKKASDIEGCLIQSLIPTD